jgi:rhamnose utilization protein RhaD (predicted bifunctional aldolase and dehydrogenase)
VALSPRLTAIATGGTLYPDHVVFCGPAATALAEGEKATRVAARFSERGLKPPPFVLAPGAGALLFRNASAGGAALARCLGDVLARIPEGAPIKYFTEDQVHDLIEWDAEKYRQALNAH